MINRIRNLILVSPIPPPSGGIATWTLNLLAYWQQKKDQIPYIRLTHVTNARRFGNITNRNVVKRILTGIVNGLIFFFHYLIVISLNGKRQVVHLTTSGSLGFIRDILALLMAKAFGAKVILHIRFGRVPNLIHKKNWESVILTMLLRGSYKIICIDKRTFECLKTKYSNAILYLPNAVIPMFLDSGRKNYTNSSGFSKEPSLLFVGHVIKAKGIFDLISAAGEIGYLELKVAGIAKANELRIITELNAKYPTLKIEILGNLTGERLIQELQSCTLFCLPSYTEGFPNAVLEAMAVGAPIVASDVGEIPEMVKVDQETAAWIFQAGDVEGLKKQLITALSDSTAREHKARLCTEKVKSTYTSEVVFDQLIKVWIDACN